MPYTLVGDRVVRDDGYVAAQHTNTNGANVKVLNTIYVFVPQYNVSMAWIAPEHIAKVLSVKTSSGCNCGGGEKLKFALSPLINVNLWSGFDRNGNPK
jgi:hypothetical protein